MKKDISDMKPIPELENAADYLTYCEKCATYSLLNNSCPKCNDTNLTHIRDIAQADVQRALRTRIIITAIVGVGFFIITPGIIFKLIVLAVTAASIIAMIKFTQMKKTELVNFELKKILEEDMSQIKEDLGVGIQRALEDLQARDVEEAYNRLRYTSMVMDSEDIRIYKVMCLNTINLTSTMALETTSLLQDDYNEYLIDYIYEVSKMRKDLIDDSLINYVNTYKKEVLTRFNGHSILASVFACSLKSKFLFDKYLDDIIEYLEYMPKDRVLRACKLCGKLKDEEKKNKFTKALMKIENGLEYMQYL